MARRVVLLPAPLARISVTISPCATARLTPSGHGWRRSRRRYSRRSARRHLLAQVGVDHLRVAADLLRGALGDGLAVVEHVDALADAHDDLHVVLDEQDGEPELVADPRIMCISSSFSCGFMPAAGSSRSSSSGSVARARAISRRRWSP